METRRVENREVVLPSYFNETIIILACTRRFQRRVKQTTVSGYCNGAREDNGRPCLEAVSQIARQQNVQFSAWPVVEINRSPENPGQSSTAAQKLSTPETQQQPHTSARRQSGIQALQCNSPAEAQLPRSRATNQPKSAASRHSDPAATNPGVQQLSHPA